MLCSWALEGMNDFSNHIIEGFYSVGALPKEQNFHIYAAGLVFIIIFATHGSERSLKLLGLRK